MKIYIHPLNIPDPQAFQTQMLDILRSTQQFTDVYTNEGFFRVDNQNVYRMEPTDVPAVVYPQYYGQCTLVVDPSSFKRTLERAVCGTEHCVQQVKMLYYRFHAKSKLSFVLECMRQPSEEEVEESWIVCDAYFESTEPVQVQELFVKQEIIEFLTFLN